ncbi:type IV secretion system protein [Rickettsiales bacterium]|nr:type IV secretion system protein [Rickettsiales bacterium]
MYNKIKYLLRLLSFIPILTFININNLKAEECKYINNENYVECYYDTISDSARNRYRSCNEFAKPEGIAQPGVMSEEDRDLEIDLTNLSCQAHMVALYTAFKTALFKAAKTCATTFPSPLPDPIGDARVLIATHYQGGLQAAQGKAWCLAAALSADVFLGLFAIDAAITRAIAASEFKKYRICGSNWKEYNTESWKKSNYGHAQNALDAFNTWKNNPSSQNPEDIKGVREWLYQGIERESKECTDKDGNPLKYYYRGFLPASNNCKQYLDNDDKNAYDCCLKDKEKICIEKTDSSGTYLAHGFCEAENGICTPGFKTSQILPRRFNIEKLSGYGGSVLCASTYDLCPYNFNVGGGTYNCALKTENCDPSSDSYDKSNNQCNKCLNYCQMFEHCVTIDTNNAVYQSEISSPYFSDACINMKGDAKMSAEFVHDSLTGTSLSNSEAQTMNFSAPISQCVKETLENVFFGRAGHTKCNHGIVNSDGNCQDSITIYRKGDEIQGGSFFSKIQTNLADFVRLALIFSITFIGFKVMIGDKKVLSKPELISYVVKMGLILYFATGQGWQSGFFDGVYNASSSIAEIFNNLTSNSDKSKRDGCQFDSESLLAKGVDQYPVDKKYLAIFDTMDCKIIKQLGNTINSDFSALGWIILSHFILGPYGIAIAVFLSIFGILLITTTIRILHIFLASAFSIIILVYISVIIIPLILFKKTQGVFKQWSAQLLGLSLQPILLFAYIGIFISIFDNVMLGSSSYDINKGTQNCNSWCMGNDGVRKYGEKQSECSDDQPIMDPETDSIACIIKSKTGLIDNSPTGLEIFGIGVSLIVDALSDPKKLFNQTIALLKGCLILFILSKFISDIPSISSQLIGGAAIRGGDVDPIETAKKAYGAAKEIGQRGSGSAEKAIRKLGSRNGEDSENKTGTSKTTPEGSVEPEK